MTKHNTRSAKATTLKDERAKLAEGAAVIKAKAAAALKEAAETALAKKVTPSTKARRFNIHPKAMEFPSLPNKEMKELKADIAVNGIQMPLLVNKAKDTILDGRNRYMIALELGIDEYNEKKLPLEVFKGTEDEIPSEILSRNVFRRHLNDDQRAGLVAKLRVPQWEAEARERQLSRLRKGDTAPNESPYETPTNLNSAERGEVADKIAIEAEVGRDKARQAVKAVKAGQIDDVIEKKKPLREAGKSWRAKKRKPKAEKSFEDNVLVKWDRFMKVFHPQERRQVRVIIHGFLLAEREHEGN